ncbi:uncharacterized mitochondrial protein-like protein, partial [Tanacetum coccineum]
CSGTAVSIGSPSSITVDQDAPSASTSQTPQESRSHVIPPSAEETDHDIEVAHMDNDPYVGIPIPEPSFEESSSQVVIPNNVHSLNQPPEHINDIIFASTRPDLCETFFEAMCSKFKMSMMGKLSIFLGLQIFYSPRGNFLNQSKYALVSLKKYGMETCEPVDTPMVEKSKLDEDLQGKVVDPTHYRGIIGTHMYHIQ